MNPRYAPLLDAYTTELRGARKRALAWWQGLLKAETALVGDKAKAELRVRERWPFGPTSHPYVIAVYRKYFIAAEQINEQIERETPMRLERAARVDEDDWGVKDPEALGEEEIIDPPTLLIDVLGERDEELGTFLTFLVFSPIGEENDRSV